MHPFLLNMHAIGAPEATSTFELQVNPEGKECNLEAEVHLAGFEEPEEEVECPNHEPASFVKGKPRSIFKSITLISKAYLIMLYQLMHYV